MSDLDGGDILDHLDSESEYFYDLVLRAPDVSDCLKYLEEQPFVIACREAAEKNFGKLTREEFDLIFDGERVDWNGVHTRYLTRISKSVHGLKSENSALKMENELIDYEEKLSEDLMVEYPTDEIKNDAKKSEQWRSAIVSLSIDFFKFIRLGLGREGKTLPEQVKEILGKELDQSNELHGQTMYYIAGAMLNVLRNMAKRCRNEYKSILDEIVTNASSDKQSAKQKHLPTLKVEEQKNDDKLIYVEGGFYSIVCRIESVFATLLSLENVERYGMKIVKDIAHALCKEDIGFSSLVSDEFDADQLREIIRRFLRSYGNLRGKDFVRKMNATRHVNQETLRSTLGARAGYEKKGTANTKKRGADDDEVSNDTSVSRFVKMFVPALKNELRKRGLKVGGKKAELIERLEEYEQKLREMPSMPKLTSAHKPEGDWKTAAMLANLDMVLSDVDVQEHIFYEQFDEYYYDEEEELQDELEKEHCTYE